MYEYDSRVRLSEVDQHQRMTLNAVLNYFQDCSSFHSEDLGVGIEYLNEHNRMWVLRSWKIVVDRYPYMGEQIKVGTWPYEFGRMTGRRNFRLLDNQGKMAAKEDRGKSFRSIYTGAGTGYGFRRRKDPLTGADGEQRCI